MNKTRVNDSEMSMRLNKQQSLVNTGDTGDIRLEITKVITGKREKEQ